MQPMTRIGPAALQTSLALLLLGLWLAIEVASRAGRRRDLPPGLIDGAGFAAVAAAIIGARLGYALQHVAAFRADPLSLVYPAAATLDTTSALLTGVAVLALLAWRRGVALRPLLDALAPGIGVLIGAIALGELAEGTHIGQRTDAPWGVSIAGQTHHPVQLYIAGPVLALTVWIMVWRGARPFDGFDFLLIIGGCALAVLIASAWREAAPTLPGNLHRESVVAWVALLSVLLAGATWSHAPNAAPTVAATNEEPAHAGTGPSDYP